MTFAGGSVYEGGNRRLGPPIITPPFIKDPPIIIASKCPCPYADRIFEAFRIDCVHKSMFLWSTTKPPIFSIRGGSTKHRF